MKSDPTINSTLPMHGHFRASKMNHEKNFMETNGQNVYMPQRAMKEEPLDYDEYKQSNSNEQYFRKNHYDRTRIQHNGSHVSDHVSVIPWRQTPQVEEGVCDSSTSPSQFDKRHIFAVPHEPKKHQYEKPSLPFRPTHNMTPAEFLAMYKGPIKDGRSSAATSLRSTVLDFPSRNGSGFSNPRHSARGRKRGLSVSPLSSTDFMDPMMFNEILRTSPSSLVAYVNSNEVRSGFASRGSGRNSSSASMASHGSYGHLSANSASPFSTPISHRQRNIFQTQSRETPLNMFKPKKSVMTSQSAFPPNFTNSMSSEIIQNELLKKAVPSHFNERMQHQNHLQNQLGNQHHIHHHNQQQNQLGNDEQQKDSKPNDSQGNNNQQEQYTNPASNGSQNNPESSGNQGEGSTQQPRADTTDDEAGGEEEAQNHQCLWKNCGIMFDNQASLVQHVNTEHIQKNKKDCSCYWQECSRGEKPFKAMYMLVVHVRRHTGEKPHKCHYEGCSKAYSRLENLKTHVRSHTGERPYVCEMPGCTKAFSNASDRAKHQNRTHSAIKQYGCKVTGCTKRYTDPSSLRKHMKTVHNALPQPTKKFKASPPDKAEDKLLVPKKEEQSPVPNEIKTEQCSSTVRNNISYHCDDHGGHGQGSPSYPVNNNFSNYSMGNSSGPSFTSQTSHNNGTSTNYGNFQRMWSNEQHQNQTGGITANQSHNIELNNRINSNMSGFSGAINQISSNLIVEVQPQINTTPRIYKPIEPQPPEIARKQINGINKKLALRRGSNTSTGSNDSGMDSSYHGSRRGSNFSDKSGLSAGRLSVTLASPLPSRTLSPRCIEPTVIEGEVLEHISYHKSNSPPTNVNIAIDQRNQFETQVKDANDNVASRMSSGYGSQNLYFPTSNRARASPAPPSSAGPRRASDGNVKRVSDSGINRVDLMKARMISRRGSEPIRTTQIMEDTPRRHSLSNYKPLPVPNAMQQSLLGTNTQTIPDVNKNNSIPNFQNMPVSSFNTMQNDVGNAANILQLMAQTNNSQQQQQQQRVMHQQQMIQQQQQLAQHRQQQQQFNQNDMLPPTSLSSNLMVIQQNNENVDSKYYTDILKAPADSTMDLTYPKENIDPLESFVNNYDMNQNQPFYPQANQYLQPNQNLNNQMNQITNFQNNNNPPSFMHPTQSSTITSQVQENDVDANYNLTLQWRNNHFHPKHIEPDSTIDPESELEKLMIEGLGSLNTNEPQPNQMNSNMSNMAINTMDTLMSSFAEENKYFESQGFNRYP